MQAVPVQLYTGFYSVNMALLAMVGSLQHMKNQKIVYKFETEWLQGTFRGQYKGKKDEYKGHFAVYFDRKNSFYLELSVESYGCDKDWVMIKKLK